jgi:HD-like signal output (HDOD) protein
MIQEIRPATAICPDQIEHLVASGNLTLPVFNDAAAKLQALRASDDVGASEVEHLILADQVLVAEVLRAANSPFFGGLAQISSVRSAIVRLGLNQVSQLALMVSHRSQYDAKDGAIREMIQQLWIHATATAMAAGWLARRLGFGKELESEAFLGGLLHDVGKLVILRAIDEIKANGKEPYEISPHLVNEILASVHPVLGGAFLQHRNIPNVYCDIAGDHHLDDFEPSRIPLVTVRLANRAAAKMGLSLQPAPRIVLSALPEAHCLNANDILLTELEIVMEDSLALGCK